MQVKCNANGIGYCMIKYGKLAVPLYWYHTVASCYPVRLAQTDYKFSGYQQKSCFWLTSVVLSVFPQQFIRGKSVIWLNMVAMLSPFLSHIGHSSTQEKKKEEQNQTQGPRGQHLDGMDDCYTCKIHSDSCIPRNLGAKLSQKSWAFEMWLEKFTLKTFSTLPLPFNHSY